MNDLVPYFEHHESIDSTNARAAQLAATDIDLPALIVAEEQTAGRGRGSNAWWSDAGALTFSLLIDASPDQLAQATWPLVSLAAALAIGDCLAARLPVERVELKWPNDVYLNGRKVCGILVEAPPVRPPRLVVGVGLNVNNSMVEAPDEIAERATSLVDAVGQPLDREEILREIVVRFLDNLARLQAGELQLAERWSERCLLRGREIEVQAHGTLQRGCCAGIDDAGALILETSQGRKRLFAGTVNRW